MFTAKVKCSQTSVFQQPASVTGAIGHARGVQETTKNLKLPLAIPFETHEPGSPTLRVQLTAFYCREDNTGTCRIKTLVWRVPVDVVNDASAPNEIKVQGKLTAE
jgi:hypothetical protein